MTAAPGSPRRVTEGDGLAPDAIRPGAEALPYLHLVTDDTTLARLDLVDCATKALRAGGARIALHLRGPGTSGRRLHDLASALLPVANQSGARLLINDRIDVAATAGAHGVHLGQRSVPLSVARRLLSRAPLAPGPDAHGSLVPPPLVGVSVHSAEEARMARGADYLLVGSIFATPSHPGRPGAGPRLLDEVRAVLPGTPLIAIGGVTPECLPEIHEAGAHGFAVLRGVWAERSPAEAVERYLRAWNENPSPSRSA